MKALATWLRRRHLPVAFLYVRERYAGYGSHTHLMVHLPNASPSHWRMLRIAFEKHLQDLCYRKWRMSANAVDVSGNGFNTPGMIHRSQRLGLLSYLSKALNPDEMVPTGAGMVKLSELLGIRAKNQASVPVKRVGCSENIGPKARKEASWRDTDDLLRLAEQVRGAMLKVKAPVVFRQAARH